MSQANRSGGPKTVQGKARSSKNATSHGLLLWRRVIQMKRLWLIPILRS